MSNLVITIPNTLTLVSSSIDEVDSSVGEVEYNPTATYAKGDRVVVKAIHKVFEAYGAVPAGKQPELNPAYWNDRGYTNRWKAFDTATTSKSSRNGSITYVIRTGAFGAIHGYGIEATSVHLELRRYTTNTLIWSADIDMIDTCYSWEQFYNFEGVYPTLKPNFFYQPPFSGYYDAELTIVINNPAGTARAGMIIVGAKYDPMPSADDFMNWGVQDGVEIGSQDNRVTTNDDYGNPVTRGEDVRRTMRFSAFVPNQDARLYAGIIDKVARSGLPAAFRVKSTSDFDWHDVFGVPESSSMTCYADKSVSQLSIKGFL